MDELFRPQDMYEDRATKEIFCKVCSVKIPKERGVTEEHALVRLLQRFLLPLRQSGRSQSAGKTNRIIQWKGANHATNEWYTGYRSLPVLAMYAQGDTRPKKYV